MATLCVIGTGHAHLNLLESIDAIVACGHKVVVVNLYPHLYYSGMAPLYVGGGCSLRDMAIPTLAIAAEKGATVIEGEVHTIDPHNQTITINNSMVQRYDVLSINMGSVTSYDGLVRNDEPALYNTVFPVKPIRGFLALKDVVEKLVYRRVRTAVHNYGASISSDASGNVAGDNNTHGAQEKRVRSARVGEGSMGGAVEHSAHNDHAITNGTTNSGVSFDIARYGDDGANTAAQHDIRIAVIGGGAAGFEVCANLRVLIDGVVRSALVGVLRAQARHTSGDTTATPSTTSLVSASSSAGTRHGRVHRRYRATHPYCKITLFTGGNPLSDFPKRLLRLSMRRASAMGINIVNARVRNVENGHTVVLDDGDMHHFDLIVLATGVAVPPLIASSSIPSADRGQMKVNSFLQSVQYPNIFGGGDCIATEPLLPNLGVFAIRQGPILAHNVQAFLNGDAASMQPFVPQKHVFFALNMGNRRGVATKYRVVWKGKTPYWLKLKFDTLFIDKYTAGRDEANG